MLRAYAVSWHTDLLKRNGNGGVVAFRMVVEALVVEVAFGMVVEAFAVELAAKARRRWRSGVAVGIHHALILEFIFSKGSFRVGKTR